MVNRWSVGKIVDLIKLNSLIEFHRSPPGIVQACTWLINDMVNGIIARATYMYIVKYTHSII